MEIEPLISGSKWSMIALLSEKSQSPTELAAKTGTSLANISQQLRLLEVAGLVRKERRGSKEKGKPHMLFSLASDSAYLVSICAGFSEKKMIPADAHHKAVMRIWLLTKPEVHASLERFYLDAEKGISGISAIAASPDSKKITVIAKDKESEKRISEIKTDLEVVVAGEGKTGKVPAGYVYIFGK
jgi:DNA-binding transcriptional ArsR family regulator